jgi:phosphatidate cytidylyltransferase
LALFAFFYLTFGFGSLILIRDSGVVAQAQAGGWLLFLFGTTWIVDTAAYFCGWKFGRAKLSPAVSPNKTIVGFIGGFAGALLSAGIFNFLFLAEVGFLRLIGPAVVVALFGQLGDLVESIFKREMGKKDSSDLIPGHGGVLDRFDSILFAAPALYLYLKYIFSG